MTSTPMQLNNNFRLPAEEILIRIPRIYMRIETPVTIIIKAHTTLLRKMLVQKIQLQKKLGPKKSFVKK